MPEPAVAVRDVGCRGTREVLPGVRDEHEPGQRRDRDDDLAACRGGRRAACREAGRERDAVTQPAGERDVDLLRGRRPVEHDDSSARRGPAAVRRHVGGIVGEERPEVAGRQRRHRPPQRGERLVVGEQRRVGRAAEVGPRVCAPVVGIVVAGDAHLVAVVHGRRAGHGELDERREPDPLLARGHVRGVLLARGGGLGARRERPQEALRVVAVEQVHERVVGGVRVVLALRGHPVEERRRLDGRPLSAKPLGSKGPGARKPRTASRMR